MSKELVAYGTSDWHLHYWEHYNKDGERTKASLEVVRNMFKRASHGNTPILFFGDLFHTPEGLKSPTINAVYPELISIFNAYPNVQFYAISGNHDQYTKNYIHSRSISYTAGLANTIKNFHLMDFQGTMLTDDVAIYGIPYLYLNTNYTQALAMATEYFNKVKAKKTILMIHTTIEGSVDTNGYSVTETALLMRELKERFTLVLSGHIHKHQRMAKGVYHVGSAVHVKVSDEGYEPVIIKILDPRHKKTLHVSTKKIEGAKVFKTFTSEEGKDNDPNIMWVYKSDKEEQVEKANKGVDISDYEGLMKKFLKSLGVKSPKRINKAMIILKEVNDDKTS